MEMWKDIAVQSRLTKTVGIINTCWKRFFQNMDPKNECDANKEEFYLSLDTLPPEIFLHICSFLSAKFVINVLSNVCQKFKDIIENDCTWRMRIFRRWPKRYPLVPNIISNWKEACIVREEHYDLWKNGGEKMKLYHLKDAHFGSVNVVNILEDGCICASGGRDGVLKLWNISSLKEQFDPLNTAPHLLHSKSAAHSNAWLWSIAYDETNKVLYSGGFDCNLRTWDISNLSKPVTTFSSHSPILCLSFNDHSLAAGCYGRSVSLFDPRTSSKPVLQHIDHKKPVLCVSCDEKFIISGSEDKTVIVYDKVAKKVLTTLKFEGFPLSMSYDCHQLLIGDVLGFFHVVDHTKGDFELLKSYETGHKMKVTGIQHSLGSIITCSTDKTIRILEPNADPDVIAVLNTTSEISKISTFKTTLVSANTDDSISVWLPEEEDS